MYINKNIIVHHALSYACTFDLPGFGTKLLNDHLV